MPLYDVLQNNPNAFKTTPSTYDRLQAQPRTESLTGLEQEKLFGNPLSRGLGQAARGMKGSVKAYVASALDAMGAGETAQGWWDGAQQDAERAAFVAPEVQSIRQVNDVDTAGQYALGAIGKGLAFIPATMAAAAAGRAGLGRAIGPTAGAHVGGAALMLPAEGGEVAQQLRTDPAAAGMSAAEKFARATGVGAINAGLEVLPEAGMVNRLTGRVPVTSLRQAAKGAAKEFSQNVGKEALTETAQDAVGQLHNIQYDGSKAFDAVQSVDAALQGGIAAGPIAAIHAPVTQGLDLLAGTGKLGSDAVQAGGKKISDTAMSAPSTGLGDAWHSYREHPELAQLMSEQTLPPELAKGSDQDVLNWAAGDDNKRRDAALVIAQRTLTNPAASEQAKAEAQGLLNNPGDPEAWRPFAGALVLQEKSRRVGANIREAAEQLGAKLPSLPEGLDAETVANKAGLGVRAAAQTVKTAAEGLSKKNLEPTVQDLNYAQLMAPRMEKAFGGQLSPDVSTAAASVLKDYVLGGFAADEHGNVTVPHGLTAAFGAETPAVVEHAFDLLRRQGRVDEAQAAKLAEVKSAVEERLPKYKRATQVVWDNLVPEQMEAVPSEDYPHIADSVRRYLDSGKKDPAAEKYLDTLFGPNKSKVLEQIDLLHERGQLKAKHYGEGVDEAGVQESDNAVEEDHDAPIGERGPSYDYHFGSKAGMPFDMEQGHTPEHMMRVSSGLDASRYATRYDKSTGKDYVHAEPVGIVDYARQTGDGAALQKLYKEHAAERDQIGDDALDRKLNSRYKVLRAQELMDDGHDQVDIRASELKRPATIKGEPNKRAWSDVTAIGTKDVSTIEHGRVFLKQKDGGEFVTSAQKLISKMWEAKKNGAFQGSTAEQAGGKDMLNMFSAGLASLLATGQFEGMDVRMPDGSMQIADKIEDLPKNFVLFTKPGGEKVRVSDALREGAGVSTSGTPASVKFETSDIPNMTRSELARALDGLAGGRLLDKGSSPNYDRFVEEAVAFIERTKANASKVESAGKDGGRLRGVAAKAERMLDAFESRVENRPPRDTGRETASGREIGIVGRETMKDAETGETIDVGHKIASDTHVVGEIEEFAAQSKGVERTFDELTGIELHPKEGRLDQRKGRIEQLRRDYKQANERLKELVAKREGQGGSIQNLEKFRPNDVVWAAVTPREETEDGHAVAVFKDFGQAQRYAEQRGLNTVQDLAMNLTPPPARKNVPLERSIAAAQQKRDALVEEGKRISAEYKAAADKAEPKRKYNSEPARKSVMDNPRFAAWFGDSKMKTKDGQPAVFYHSTDNTFDEFDTRMAGRNTDHASTGLGVFLSPSKERSKVYGQHSMALYVRMEKPYKMSVEEFSGFKDQASAAARQAELRAQGYDGVFVPADKTTIVFDPTQLKSIDNNGNFGIFDANIKRNMEATRLHEELGRSGFGATHDAPVRHAGEFNWREHQGKGEGNAAFGAGTYLSTADGVHAAYKAQFTEKLPKRKNEYGHKFVENPNQMDPHQQRMEDFILQMEAVEGYPQDRMDAFIRAFKKSVPMIEKDMGDHSRTVYADKSQMKPFDPSLIKELEQTEGLKNVAVFMREFNEALADQNPFSKVAPSYHVSVNASQHELLDWDAPLGEQSGKVQEALYNIYSENELGSGNPEDLFRGRATGAQIYNDLVKELGSQRAASDMLQEYGIVGHKYASSGGRNSDHPNYVIYDDSRIETNYVSFNREAPGDATANFATPEQIKEAQDYVAKTLGPQMQTEWVKSFPHGGSGEWQQGIIRLATSALNPLSVAHHESMHELFQRLTAAKRDKVAQTLLQAANSPLTLRRLERFFADKKYEAVREAIKTDPEERLAYMYQLWASGKMKFGPETQTVFQKVADFVRKITGMLTNDQRAEMIMQAFYEGKMAEPNAMAEALNDIDGRGQTLRSIGKRMKPVASKALELVATAESNLAASTNPAVREIQTLFSNSTGSTDKGQGFLQAQVQANNQWLNKMGAALHASDAVEKADIAAALEGLQKGERSSDPVIGKIQAGVRKVLDDMHEYLREADVRRFDSESKQWAPIEKVRDYFPRSWDTSKLMADGDKFVAALIEHHSDALVAIATQANKERAADGDAGKYTASWEKAQKNDTSAVTPEDVARAIHQRLLNSDGQAELGEQTNALGYTPMMKAVNQRTLNWIDMKHFSDFQRKDMVQTLTTYVNQATKRAEYARLFGGDGAKLEAKMTEAWHHEIDNLAREQYGVDKASAKAAQAARSPDEWENHLHDVLKVSKAEAQKLIQSGLQNLEPVRRAVMAMEGTLGHDISPLLRKVSAYSIVYQNTRLLAYAMFSNLIDPLGIIVRGGELKDAYSAFKRGMTSVVREWGDMTGLREAKEGDVDEATRIAEMIGTVDCAGFMSTMGNMYGSQFLPQWARNWNDNFFRWNGMESFNKAMRVQATQAAIGFIKRHGGEKTNEHSERYLRELGLTAEDVKLGADGRLNVEDPKIQKAVMRWVDGAILRPNAALRPTWMSDPHYAVFGHLKQFMYATHEVLLKRIVHEVKNGNTDPMMTFLAGYIPVMLVADSAKGILQEIVGGGTPTWQHDSVGGIVAHGVERAGGLGVAQMGVDTVKYGPTSLLGPQVEQIMSAFSNPVNESIKEAAGVGPLSIMMKGAKMTNVVD